MQTYTFFFNLARKNELFFGKIDHRSFLNILSILICRNHQILSTSSRLKPVNEAISVTDCPNAFSLRAISNAF